MKKTPKSVKAWAVNCCSTCNCGILQVVLTEFERDFEMRDAERNGCHLEVIEVLITPLKKKVKV